MVARITHALGTGATVGVVLYQLRRSLGDLSDFLDRRAERKGANNRRPVTKAQYERRASAEVEQFLQSDDLGTPSFLRCSLSTFLNQRWCRVRQATGALTT